MDLTYDQRLELGKSLTKGEPTPFVSVFFDGVPKLCFVVWAKADKLRVRRWVPQTRIYASPETVPWERVKQIVSKPEAASICAGTVTAAQLSLNLSA
jgi:hypothetical protein